jgi:hypothetical protein
MPDDIKLVIDSLSARVNTLSDKLVELASREIKKSQAESVAFALGSASNTFRFGDSHNLLAKSGAHMDMNSCPLCGTLDSNGFCACLSVMAKSEDVIDLKNAADPKKRIKEVPGPHEGKLPSDEKIKEVDVGDGTGGEVKKSRIPGVLRKDFGLTGRAAVKADQNGTAAPTAPKVNAQPANPNGEPMAAKQAAWATMPHEEKLKRVQSLMSSPNAAPGTLFGDKAQGVAQEWMQRFGNGQGAKASAAAPAPAPAAPAGVVSAPSAAAPSSIPGQKQVSLPGAGMAHAPKAKQAVGGDVVGPNPQKAAPGLGSMRDPSQIRGKLIRSEDANQFETFQKSEDFDFGNCALCGNHEHIGVCK